MKPWIKLWREFLHDYKVISLAEYMQLRFIKLLLIADDDGRLPSVKQIAHGLELMDGVSVSSKVQDTLAALSRVGVVGEDQQGWFIVNWSKRQSPNDPTAADRMKRYRERQSVTRNVTRNASSSTSSSDSVFDSLRGDVFKSYEQEIGVLTPKISNEIATALEDYPPDWIVASFGEAARNNKRSWSYAKAILKRWKVDGFQSRNKNNGRETALRPEDMASEVYE